MTATVTDNERRFLELVLTKEPNHLQIAEARKAVMFERLSATRPKLLDELVSATLVARRALEEREGLLEILRGYCGGEEPWDARWQVAMRTEGSGLEKVADLQDRLQAKTELCEELRAQKDRLNDVVCKVISVLDLGWEGRESDLRPEDIVVAVRALKAAINPAKP